MGEALHDRTRPAAASEPARRERVGHQHGRGAIARRPRAAVRLLGRDPARELGRLGAVEEHIRGEPLRQRPRPALEREHRQDDGQERRHERRAVYPRLYHEGRNLQFPGLSATAPRILLVDDELSVQKLLTYPLRKEGYDVIPALDGREALERLRDDNFDLVVLDVMLPRMDGFDVCRAIRSRSTVPIIMLTAKTEETDKVLGLELGADDYITKPFSVREFRSRVKAVLRRAALAQPEAQFEEPIDAGDLHIDFEKRTVVARGETARLTYVEFEILAALARAPGRVFSRTMLLERVWGDAAYRDPRTIDVHIRHLREKLEAEPKTPELILTVRGVGYRFRDS
jgi:DNA-binding response OmpR family regulator